MNKLLILSVSLFSTLVLAQKPIATDRETCTSVYDNVTQIYTKVCTPYKEAPVGPQANHHETLTAPKNLTVPGGVVAVAALGVQDGQSFTGYMDYKEVRFRLAGIATPARGRAMGREAMAYLGQLIPSRSSVLLELTGKRDTDGAQLVYLWLNGELMNLAFVERGLAQPSPLGNEDYADVLAVGLKYARDKKVGMWAMP